MNSSLQAALRCAALGWRVYPVWGIKDGKCLCGGVPGCKPGKHPWGKMVHHGGKQATTDSETIKTWFPTGYVNVGISVDGFMVLDVEKKGMEMLAEWEAQYGKMPTTPTARSGSGGRHYYFKRNAEIEAVLRTNEGIKFVNGVELLVSGCVIAPASNHISGGQYQWIIEPEMPFAEMPEWLVSLVVGYVTGVRNGRSHRATSFDPMKGTIGIGETFADIGVLESGKRNERVNSIIGSMLGSGYTREQILESGTRWAEQQEPPYSVAELEQKVEFFAKKQDAKFEEQNTAEPLEADCHTKPTFGVRSFGSSATVKSTHNPHPVEPSCGLPDAAYYGIVGEFVKAVEPLTEADPAGILACVLTGVGNALGRESFHRIGRRHSGNLFSLLVGDTSSRKGTCWDVAESLLSVAAPEWATACVENGFGSGQGFVHRIRDASEHDDGVPDKRLLVVEEEWAKPLRLCRADSSILSPLIRSAYDGKPLVVMNRGENRYGCREPHVSIIGMITAGELLELVKGRTEIVNGTINRFLLVNCERRRYLPTGGDYYEVGERFAPELRDRLAASRRDISFSLGNDAAELWNNEYRRLEQQRDGDYGKAVARLSVHCLKVAMLYAALDGSSAIGVSHLKAALAFVDYCDKSAFTVFGKQKPKASGDEPFADEPKHAKLLNLIRSRTDGINKTDAHRLFHNEMKADELNGLFALLVGSGFIVEMEGRWYAAECFTEKGNTGGGVVAENESTEGPNSRRPNAEASTPDCSSPNLPNTGLPSTVRDSGVREFGEQEANQLRRAVRCSAFGKQEAADEGQGDHPPPVMLSAVSDERGWL